jgi:hypothetical protein
MEKNEGIFTPTGLVIGDQPWLTKPAMLEARKIKKSLFYIWLSQGRIISHQPFSDVAFHVYRLATDKEGDAE